LNSLAQTVSAILPFPFLGAKTYTPTFIDGFAPSTSKLELNQATAMDYFQQKFPYPSYNRFGLEILTT